MNWRIILKIQGLILVIIALAMIPSALFSLIYHENDMISILSSILITLTTGIILSLTIKQTNLPVRAREGFVAVTLGWIGAAIFSALPFYIHGSFGSYINALFESMSGLTTTGASILTNIEIIPHGLLFWRSTTHWLGGMGIILLTVVVLPFFGIQGNQLFKAEVPGPVKDRFIPRISDTAKILWFIYAGLTVIQTLLLIAGGMSIFDSLCHTFGTMATGGFSTKNLSVAAYNSVYLESVIVFFMYLAGINFTLYFYILKGDIKGFIKNREWQFYTLVLLGSTIIITLSLFFSGTYESFFEAFHKSIFQVVSITTTTGFCTADFNLWPFFSQMILIFLMFFGGSGGSTGGGIKQIRIMILLKACFREIKTMAHPNGVFSTRIEHQHIPDKVVRGILGFFVIFIITFSAVTLFLCLMGYDIITSFSASIATLSNIGPGLARVGAVENFNFFDPLSKLVLTFNMLLGRLELYSVIVAIYYIFSPKQN